MNCFQMLALTMTGAWSLDKMGTKLDPVQDRLDYVVPDQVKKFFQYF